MTRNLLLLLTTIGLLGVSAFFRKLALNTIHPYQLQIVAGAVYALEVPVWMYLISREGITGWDSRGVTWGALCILSYVVAAVSLGFLLKSSDNPGVLVTLVSMSPVVTLLLTVAFLGERLSPSQLAATGLMLSGLALFNLGKA